MKHLVGIFFVTVVLLTGSSEKVRARSLYWQDMQVRAGSTVAAYGQLTGLAALPAVGVYLDVSADPGTIILPA